MNKLLGCFVSLVVFTASYVVVAQEKSVQKIDCTPQCGNPTCCIAAVTVTVPTCVVEGQQAVGELKYRFETGDGPGASNMCSNGNLSGGKSLLKGEGPKAVERLACHWGCCKNSDMRAFALQNPGLLSSSVSETENVALMTKLEDKSASEGDVQSAVKELESTDRLCVFCCTF